MTHNKISALLVKTVSRSLDGLMLGSGYEVVNSGTLSVNVHAALGEYSASSIIEVRSNKQDGVGVEHLSLNVEISIINNIATIVSASITNNGIPVEFSSDIYCADLEVDITNALSGQNK